MPLNINRTSTNELCSSLKPFFSDLRQLPYNRFTRDNTVWWLSPGKETPAYRFPKFAVMPPEEDTPDQLFVGIYIEKGVSETYAKAVGYSKHHILGPNWAWNSLMNEMASGDRLNASISQVRSATGENPELHLYASMQVKDAAKELAPKGEKLVFEAAEYLTVRPSETKSKLLVSLEGCTTLPELAAGLNKLDKAEFIWIDLVLGLPLAMKDDGHDWDAEAIAKKVMAALEWVVG